MRARIECLKNAHRALDPEERNETNALSWV